MGMQVLRNREDKLTFGKLKGRTISDAIKCHPKYCHWLKSNGIILIDRDVPSPNLADDIEEAYARVRGYAAGYDHVDPDEDIAIGMEDPAWGF